MVVATLSKLVRSGSSYSQTYTTPILYIPEETSTFSLTAEGITIIGDIQENNSSVVDMTLCDSGKSLRMVELVEGVID